MNTEKEFFCVYIAKDSATMLKEQALKFGVDSEQYAAQLLTMAVRREFSAPVNPLTTIAEQLAERLTNIDVQLGTLLEHQAAYIAPAAAEPVAFEYDETPLEDYEPEDDHGADDLFMAINDRLPESDEFEIQLRHPIGGRIFDLWMPQISTKIVMAGRTQTVEDRTEWNSAGMAAPGILEFVESDPESIEMAAATIAERWGNIKGRRSTPAPVVIPDCIKMPEPQPEQVKPQQEPVKQEPQTTMADRWSAAKPAPQVATRRDALAQSVQTRHSSKTPAAPVDCYAAIISGLQSPPMKSAGIWNIAHGEMFTFEMLDNATAKTFDAMELRRAISKLVQDGILRRFEIMGAGIQYRVIKPLGANQPAAALAPQSVKKADPAPAIVRPTDNAFYERVAAELMAASRLYGALTKTYSMPKIFEMVGAMRADEANVIAAVLTLKAEGFLKETERQDEKRYSFEQPPRAETDRYRRATQNAIATTGGRLPGMQTGEAFTAYDVRRVLDASERHHAAICFALAGLASIGLLTTRTKRTVTNMYTVA